jgi:hypothetical protein
MPAPGYRPVDPGRLAAEVAATLAAVHLSHPLRVAVDGPRCADPAALARDAVEPLRLAGHPAYVVEADTFWRDASLRLEWGRTDVEAYTSTWLDVDALRREVLEPLGPSGTPHFLPALRDPVTNRSARVDRVSVTTDGVVLVAGDLLLGRGLPFDCRVHLAVDAAARARLTAPDWRWTLPAYDAYERDVQPQRHAEIVVRRNDPRHPAIRVQISPATHESTR